MRRSTFVSTEESRTEPILLIDKKSVLGPLVIHKIRELYKDWKTVYVGESKPRDNNNAK